MKTNRVEIGIWINPREYGDMMLHEIKQHFDLVMMSVSIYYQKHNRFYWERFAGIKRGISYRFPYRTPDGENLDHVAQQINLEAADNSNADFHYTDEPYRVAQIEDVHGIHAKLNELERVIARKGKHLIIGEGWRAYENKIFNLTAWTYFSTWFKFFVWWLKIPEWPWLNCYGRKNILELNSKHGVHHIWVHAEKRWQWEQLYKLAQKLNIPLMLFVASKLTADEKIIKINLFYIFIQSQNNRSK